MNAKKAAKRAPIVRRTPLKRHTRLRRVSPKRILRLRSYYTRALAFLAAHPYCQVWLREHGLTEQDAIAGKGFVKLSRVVGTTMVLWDSPVPKSEEVHHTNKRRGARLLEEADWLAVSAAAHDRIEANKAWAREQGYLKAF